MNIPCHQKEMGEENEDANKKKSNCSATIGQVSDNPVDDETMHALYLESTVKSLSIVYAFAPLFADWSNSNNREGSSLISVQSLKVVASTALHRYVITLYVVFNPVK